MCHYFIRINPSGEMVLWLTSNNRQYPAVAFMPRPRGSYQYEHKTGAIPISQCLSQITPPSLPRIHFPSSRQNTSIPPLPPSSILHSLSYLFHLPVPCHQTLQQLSTSSEVRAFGTMSGICPRPNPLPIPTYLQLSLTAFSMSLQIPKMHSFLSSASFPHRQSPTSFLFKILPHIHTQTNPPQQTTLIPPPLSSQPLSPSPLHHIHSFLHKSLPDNTLSLVPQ